MKKLKVMTVLGTRPEIIRLSRVIECLDKNLHHVLVHTGQNYDYELNEVFFKDLGIRKPNYFLRAAGKTPSKTIGNVIAKTDDILAKESPDAILVLGDTNSCLAALSAKRRKIPVFHMEAGNRCFDQRVPEEINRKIVDHISDINMPYSHIARQYLLMEGIAPDRVVTTGSPMFEVLNFYREKIDISRVLQRLELRPFEYFVISAHREENIDSDVNFAKFVQVLKALCEKFNKRIIVSTHPRTRKRLSVSNIKLNKNIEFLKPFGFFDYVKLQKDAFCVLSDSGTINEESSILNFPALNIREAHERPEGMEETAVMMVGMNIARILQGIDIIKVQPRDKERGLRLVSDYNAPNVSQKVLRIIMSYTDYVNRTVWHK